MASSTSGKTFASDNYAGAHPEILQAITEANAGHAGSYGADAHTAAAQELFRKLFGPQTETFFVYNGTGANVVGLSAITRSWQSIICAEAAHIQVDESTAPEKFTGCKLLPVAAPNGKITPDVVLAHVIRLGDQHHAQPAVISISQTTEYGTLYTPEEVRALADVAHQNGMLLHMDGSRISNAAAALDMEFRRFTVDAGVDVLSFGGTKNGMLFGEAVVFFDPSRATDLPYLRKQGMQLHSKMRFISAQFNALLSGDLWKRNAGHANRMAQRLADGLRAIPGIVLTQPVQANAIFATMPPAVIPALQKEYPFYVWNEAISEVRLMGSWDTTEEDVDAFCSALRKAMAQN